MTAHADFGNALAMLFQAIRLYPEKHPLRRDREEQLHASWSALNASAPLEIDFEKRSFLLGDKGSRRIKSPLFEELAREASDLGLRFGSFNEAGDALAFLLQVAAGEAFSDSEQSIQPTPPQLPAQAPLEDWLGSVWNKILETRTFDASAMAQIVRGLEQQPGCGSLTPVSLRTAEPGRPSLIAHSLNMGRLVQLAARTAGLRSSELERAVEAALLCDIGMLSVPSELVTSEKRLGPAEFRLIRKHPLDGARMILATAHAPPLAAVVAFHHHRRRDQTGYPQFGEATPTDGISLLVQVADVYAALRTPRSFRSGVPEDKARELLAQMSGRSLDPEAVDLLVHTTLPAGTVLMTPTPAFSTL